MKSTIDTIHQQKSCWCQLTSQTSFRLKNYTGESSKIHNDVGQSVTSQVRKCDTIKSNGPLAPISYRSLSSRTLSHWQNFSHMPWNHHDKTYTIMKNPFMANSSDSHPSLYSLDFENSSKSSPHRRFLPSEVPCPHRLQHMKMDISRYADAHEISVNHTRSLKLPASLW